MGKMVLAILEVMDKEPSLFRIWFFYLFIAVGGFLLGRYRRWLLFFVMPIATLFAWVHLSDLHDPYIGPDIFHEAGQHYFTQSYIAMAVAITVPPLSLLSKKRRTSE